MPASYDSRPGGTMTRRTVLFLLCAGAALLLVPLKWRERPTDLKKVPPRTVRLIEPDCPAAMLPLLVSSAAGNAARRNAIRDAYPRADLETLLVRRVFLLGRPGDSAANSTESMDRVLEEAREHGDVLLGDFFDTYRNLTLKHLTGLEWAASRCAGAGFLMKMDDDVVVDLFSILKLMRNGTVERGAISGYGMRGRRPERALGNKWRVSEEEYPGSVYPDFVSGWFYATTMEVTRKLVARAARLREWFWIDDVFVTGVLRQAVEVRVNDLEELFATDFRFLECCLRGRKSRLKCDVLIGPDGGRVELQAAFRRFAEFCYKGCVERDWRHAVKRTCVAEYRERWSPVGASAKVEPVDL